VSLPSKHTHTHTACIFNMTEHVELVFHSDSSIQAPLYKNTGFED